MKVCTACGAYNSDERSFCVDCGAKLGDSISDKELKKLERKISSTTEELYNKNDPLYVSVFDRIMGFASLGGITAVIAVFFIAAFKSWPISGLLYSLIFFGCGAIESFFPSFVWSLTKGQLSFTIMDAESTEPSSFYLRSRKSAEVLLPIIGVVIIIFTFFGFKEHVITENVFRIDGMVYSLDHLQNDESYFEADYYIEKNPKLWEEITSGGSWVAEGYTERLEKYKGDSVISELMIKAIIDIEDLGEDFTYTNTEDFLQKYKSK